jgi:hypothetical protein
MIMIPLTHMSRIFKVLLSVSVLVVIAVWMLSCSKEEDEPQPQPEGIFINEIVASGAGDDWIELYNDLDVTKDLGGFAIYDDATNKYSIPNGTSIPAKGFLILNCNGLGTGLNTNFRLSSTGEIVYLDNAFGQLIDKVQFPALADGVSYGRYPDGTSVLSISGNITKGASNGTVITPAIMNVSRTPLVPTLNQAVTIRATVVNTLTLSTVKLYYRLNTATFNELTMTLSGSEYVATIPAANATGKMDYYVQVTSTTNLTNVSPQNAPNKTFSYLLNTDVLPLLVINEFMAANTSCCPDKDSGADEFDDWIEIYNAGNVAVDIAGMYVSDDKSNPFKHKIPSSNATLTTIPPKGYLVLWADSSPDQGVLHLDFNLSAAGEDIGIYYIDGRAIDTYTFGAQLQNVSWGRTTDGAATWKAFNTPTQGKANQ